MKFEDDNFKEEFTKWLDTKSQKELVQDLEKYCERKIEDGKSNI